MPGVWLPSEDPLAEREDRRLAGLSLTSAALPRQCGSPVAKNTTRRATETA